MHSPVLSADAFVLKKPLLKFLFEFDNFQYLFKIDLFFMKGMDKRLIFVRQVRPVPNVRLGCFLAKTYVQFVKNERIGSC